MKKIFIAALTAVFLLGCYEDSQETKDLKKVESQQSQYAKGQPVPAFDWSLERHLVAELYKIRNAKVATHAVWRSDYGLIEGDCPSMGFGLPYDTSLTNPLRATDEDADGYDKASLTTIEQAEPNGIFASKNTSATWVMCIGDSGQIEPVYVESKVTIYPGPVNVNYDKNRVTRTGAATVRIKK
ncbi:MAG: hypothetical protein ACYS5F_15260 [Planctomycetota bacterium]|jgi:hypothetical protein